MRTGQIHKLTARQVQTHLDGRYSDGGGLWFEVRGNSRRFFFRFTWQGAKRDIAIGPFPTTTLAKARAIATEHRQNIADGIDPRRPNDKGGETLGQMLSEYMDLNSAIWRNQKHRQQWTNSLEQHAGALLELPARDITTADVVGVMTPIWRTKTETATRVRQRLEKVLNYAIAMGQASPPNAALWGGNLEFALPKPAKVVVHHAAASVGAVPGIYAALAARKGTGSAAMRFCILTACRSGEARHLEWADVGADTIVIPAERMKMNRPHRIPITPALAELLDAQERFNKIVFPSQTMKPLSDMALAMSLRRIGYNDITPHGFRSTFSQWAYDNNWGRDLVEDALAHQIGTVVERAYRRGDFLEQRRELMAAWADVVTLRPEPILSDNQRSKQGRQAEP